MKKQTLKLFVWTEFCPDYTSGLAFAIARDETHARALVAKHHKFEPHAWGNLQVLPLTRPVTYAVSGGG